MKINLEKDFKPLERSLFPSTVFHLTKEAQTLFDILESSCFRASYAKEIIVGPDTRRKFGIPMVSFCDIRLSQLYEHTKKYGYFGLGLKKKWAIKNGLNPVSYLNSQCTMFKYFNKELRDMSATLRQLDSDHEYKTGLKKYKSFINVMRYMKNYEGDLTREGKTFKNYRFANESEWRYVPDINEKIISIKVVRDDDSDWKRKANEKLWKSECSKLSFDIYDVKYIMVPNEQYSWMLIEYLKNIADGDDYIYLVSKIFISRQISNDL